MGYLNKRENLLQKYQMKVSKENGNFL